MLTIPAIISKISTLADGTIRLVVDTNELSPNKMTEIFSMRNLPGLCSFTANANFSADEMEMLEKMSEELSGDTSPSKRLRNVLYVWHRDSGMDSDFESFYKTEIEKITEHYKKKLNG